MTGPAETNSCFLLTHSSRDNRGRFEITLFAKDTRGTVAKIVVDNFKPMFFVGRETPAEATNAASLRKPLEMKTMDGALVDCLYFDTYAACQECARGLRAAGVRTFESDVYPGERYLMERQVCGGFSMTGSGSTAGRLTVFRNPVIRGADVNVDLSVLSLDIETNAATGELYCAACAGKTDRVFMIGDAPGAAGVVGCKNEKELLSRLFGHIASEEPDVLIGWNVVDFDLTTIQTRCSALGISLDVGRSPGARILPPASAGGHSAARIPGRVVLDAMTMLRAFGHTFDEYSLDYVASRMLGEGKTISATGGEKIAEINRLFAHDKQALARYNLHDALLTRAIFDKAAILANAVERSKRSGLPLDRTGGNVAAFDHLYLPRLHREGYVALDVADITPPLSPLAGGYVMEPKAGLYENVLVFDFRSLYPSIIMTFCIDPLGRAVAAGARIQGPVGPSFSTEKNILPRIIAELLDARAQARATGNQSLSLAIKILMNSFYGVLGSTGCRFFSPDLAAAITGTGQYILKTTVEHIEKRFGFPVIYGDTDSFFVLLGPGAQSHAVKTGEDVAAEVNTWLSDHVRDQFGGHSALEIKFETHFRYFLMTALRGGGQGGKKRYCGATEQEGKLDLVFKGLESARSDWTPLAKEFQHELYMRTFTGAPLDDYIIATVKSLRLGECDAKLVYRKGVRKALDEYTDSIPQHIQAARLLGGEQPSRISYVMTTQGPQPVVKQTAPLDYNHYIEAQLRPIADAVLELSGRSFDAIVMGQQELFK